MFATCITMGSATHGATPPPPPCLCSGGGGGGGGGTLVLFNNSFQLFLSPPFPLPCSPMLHIEKRYSQLDCETLFF